MTLRGFGAALIAALMFSEAAAQDVTLTSRDGALSLSGTLLGYDGEFFRIETRYGQLTVDGQGVTCDGPACPDLTAPKATIRIVGAADAGALLLPPLVAAFAKAHGLTHETGETTTLRDGATGEVLAEFSFAALPPEEARAAVLSGAAEMALASVTEPDLGARAVALDAMVPIVAPDNPLPRISTKDLARVLAGEVENWSQVGGPDMPLVLHGLTPGADVQRALEARLGRAVAASVTHETLAELASAVAADPWGIAVTERAAVGQAAPLDLTDSCGFPLLPSRLAVKAQDYPLTLPVFLLTPRHRLPLMARDFLDFLSAPAAQAAIARAGYIDRRAERQPMTSDGLRLINAIKGAGEETTLADLKRLAEAMDGAERLSLTFRFEGGTTTLDASSQNALTDLAQMLEAGLLKGQTLTLVGFSDGSGAAGANLKLARSRAEAVLEALRRLLPGMPEDRLPQVDAFGEALPMACDETGAGRKLNRRVELWLKPDFVVRTNRCPDGGGWRKTGLLEKPCEVLRTNPGLVMPSEIALRAKAQLARFADDQVVMQHDAKHPGGILDLGGHVDIGLGRRGVARRMVVHQDQRRGIQLQRPLDHLARVDGHMVDRALGLFLVRDQHVLAIEEQDAELFGFAVAHRGMAIVQQRIPGRQNGLVHHPCPHQPLGRGFDNLQLLHNRFAHALDHQKPSGSGRDDAVEIAKCVKKLSCQGFHVLAGNGAEQEKLQQFVIGHRPRPTLHEAGTQALAMIGNIGGQLARKGGVPRFILIPRRGEERQERVGEACLCHATSLAQTWLPSG